MEFDNATFDHEDYENEEFPQTGATFASSIQSKPPSVFSSTESSIAIGAKTVAGVGIGLLTVVAGTTLLAALSEAIIIPSLLIKLAGGIAGGGVGMAKGLSDERKVSQKDLPGIE